MAACGAHFVPTPSISQSTSDPSSSSKSGPGREQRRCQEHHHGHGASGCTEGLHLLILPIFRNDNACHYHPTFPAWPKPPLYYVNKASLDHLHLLVFQVERLYVRERENLVQYEDACQSFGFGSTNFEQHLFLSLPTPRLHLFKPPSLFLNSALSSTH
jgi:hypothetical protein